MSTIVTLITAAHRQLSQSRFIAGLIPALLLGIFIIDTLTPLGVAVCILYLIPLTLTLRVGGRRAPQLVGGIAAALTIVGLFISQQGLLHLALINRSMMIATLTATSLLIWTAKKNREALNREVMIRIQTEKELQQLTRTLEQRIEERTNALARSQCEAIEMMHEAQAARRTAQDAEETARKTAEELRDLYDNAPCGYHSLNEEGCFISINETELNWLGYERHEVIGKMRFTDFLTTESAQLFQDHFAQFIIDGDAHDLECEMVRKDGTCLYVLLNASMIRDIDGRYVSSRSTVFDITERKRAEQDLGKQTTILQSVLNSIGEGVIVADNDGHFLLWNPAAERILGLGPTRLPSHEWSTYYGIYLPDQITKYPPDQLPLVRALRGESVDGDEQFVRHQGAPAGISLSVTGRPLMDQNGRQRGGVVVFSDITDRKRSESTMKLRAAELEAVNKELEAFSYSVSHDLRAPLRHIDGFADLLRKQASSVMDDKSRRRLDIICESAKRMGCLIDDLLMFSRMGRHEMRMERVNLNQLMKDVLNDHALELGQRNIAWSISDLPDVRGDSALLRQVFANLIGNAIKYTSTRQQAAIEIGCNEVNGDETEIFIRDNGVGFDMQYAHKLFGVFQRLHSVTEFEGTGIGLAHVRRIIARHGGRTWAQGTVNRGATFYVSLPTMIEEVTYVR